MFIVDTHTHTHSIHYTYIYNRFGRFYLHIVEGGGKYIFICEPIKPPQNCTISQLEGREISIYTSCGEVYYSNTATAYVMP